MGAEEFEHGNVLGTSGLRPGDGLLVADPRGVKLWGPRVRGPERGFKWPWETRGTVQVNEPTATFLEGGTPLIVVEGDAGTAGVVVVTPEGRRTVVTDIDVKTGAVVALSRSGNVREVAR